MCSFGRLCLRIVKRRRNCRLKWMWSLSVPLSASRLLSHKSGNELLNETKTLMFQSFVGPAENVNWWLQRREREREKQFCQMFFIAEFIGCMCVVVVMSSGCQLLTLSHLLHISSATHSSHRFRVRKRSEKINEIHCVCSVAVCTVSSVSAEQFMLRALKNTLTSSTFIMWIFCNDEKWTFGYHLLHGHRPENGKKSAKRMHCTSMLSSCIRSIHDALSERRQRMGENEIVIYDYLLFSVTVRHNSVFGTQQND